jgi:type I restriction enzyme S subunit
MKHKANSTNESTAMVSTVGAIHELPLQKDLPEGWVWKTIGEISEKPQYGWTTKAKHEEGHLKLLRTTDITSGTIDWFNVPYCTDKPEDIEKYLIKSGDILISRAGSIGVSYLVNNPERAVFASYLIRFRPKQSMDEKYVYYYLKSPDYWTTIGTSKVGIAVPNVNATKLSQVPIPIAPLTQQKRIVAEIEKQFSLLDEAVAALKRLKANLKRYKASVLKAAVEGKLTEEWRKEHPDVEPASELLKRILTERRKKWEEDYIKKYVGAHGHAPKDDSWK